MGMHVHCASTHALVHVCACVYIHVCIFVVSPVPQFFYPQGKVVLGRTFGKQWVLVIVHVAVYIIPCTNLTQMQISPLLMLFVLGPALT